MLNDLRIVRTVGAETPVALTWQTEANTTAIVPGEPLKLKEAGSKYVIRFADGDLTIGTSTAMVGIAKSASTQTASADGEVEVHLILPGTVLAVSPKVAGAADTEAKIKALEGAAYEIDLTSTKYTLDTAAGHNANHAFVVVGGNPERDELYVVVRQSGTILN
jgi:hypothetical protein